MGWRNSATGRVVVRRWMAKRAFVMLAGVVG